MDMSLIIAMGVTAVVTIIGGGGGYLIWMRQQPRKIAWNAYVYQLGEGVREPDRDKKGNIVSDLKLQDLRPYIKDILVRVEAEHTQTIHKLERLNMTTNAVNADMVDVWGNNEKNVAVLLHKGTATILKKGYDKLCGDMIFSPMPRERQDMIKSEMIIKKDRLKREKGILEAITPWVVAGIAIIGLVGITYLITSSYTESSKNQENAQKYAADQGIKAAETYRDAISTLAKEVNEARETLKSTKDFIDINKDKPPAPMIEPEKPQAENLTLGRQN